MNILVTNDDGIDSPGLRALAVRLTTIGEVTVFAPSENASGASVSIGHIGPGLPDVFRVSRDDLGAVAAAYHLDGPPALATLLACQGMLGPSPDVVVSGINAGWNVGHAVHFSGTVGACVAADVFGVPGIAVSQVVADDRAHQFWETAAEVAASMVDDLIAAPRLLNVNVPNLPTGQLAGTRTTTLADRLPYGIHAPRLLEQDGGRHRAEFERFGPFESPPGSDTHAVLGGFVSVTALVPTRAATD